MKLYSGSAEQFIIDNEKNYIMDKMKLNYFYKYRYEPSENELLSWKNSLGQLCSIFRNAGLKDNGVILEYKLPLTSKKLNCIVTGKSKENKDKELVIELKEWEKTHESSGRNEVAIDIAGLNKEILHPSVQTHQYIQYFKGVHTAFNDDNASIEVNGCTYLHNYDYEDDDTLQNEKFKDICSIYPMFSSNETSKLEKFIKNKVGNGQGSSILKKIEDGKFKPDKKLMNHVADVIKGLPQYVLIHEQQIAYIIFRKRQSGHRILME